MLHTDAQIALSELSSTCRAGESIAAALINCAEQIAESWADQVFSRASAFHYQIPVVENSATVLIS